MGRDKLANIKYKIRLNPILQTSNKMLIKSSYASEDTK